VKFINETPYHSGTLERLFMIAWVEAFGERVSPPETLEVYITGPDDKPPRTLIQGDVLVVRLPELTGSEWVHLIRQQNGILSDPGEDEGPPYSWEILRSLLQLFRAQEHNNVTHLDKLIERAAVPRLLPLQRLQPPEG
jgi:hypothetical protein